jgi:pimeloyl-ACP methyl ester carboxylesterase
VNSIPLILLSGMGADERLFAPQREAFPQLIVPRWIAPESNESLSKYAARLARQIEPAGPCFVGGASFGGFVALEMARHLQARACFLIGSIRSPDQLPLRIRALRACRGAATRMPFEWVCRIAGVSTAACGALSAPSTRALLQQLSEADADFLRWACGAVLAWQPAATPLSIPVYHIHGRRDRVLPVAGTTADVIVEGAGHVLSMTHAAEVNEFLRVYMDRERSSTEPG